MMLRGALAGFLPAAPRVGFGFMFLVFLAAAVFVCCTTFLPFLVFVLVY
jgi:hypothetical protein